MKNNQTILCDVEACKHHDCQSGCGCCKLNSITITPGGTETAHYCKNYQQKH